MGPDPALGIIGCSLLTEATSLPVPWEYGFTLVRSVENQSEEAVWKRPRLDSRAPQDLVPVPIPESQLILTGTLGFAETFVTQ